MAGGRPKGSLNKKSIMLLRKLEKEHNFFIVDKIIELYNEIEAIGKPLMKKAIENVARGNSPTDGFSPEEINSLNACRERRWTILSKLLAYCYPKLKALEIGTADHDKITFNINVPRDQVEIAGE